MCLSRNSLWKNKATIGFAFLGVCKALADYYWVFNLPLESTNGSETSGRTLYMIAQCILYAAFAGGFGYIIDRINLLQRKPEEIELMPSTS
jgi:hypothetical protein